MTENQDTELRPDFNVADHGSVVVMTPLTPAARDWTTNHLPDDCPQWCGGFAIGSSWINAIMEGLSLDGLRIRLVS
jgi:hypothetical protein